MDLHYFKEVNSSFILQHTLGTPMMLKRWMTLIQAQKTYLHHYNFPPYSVGETRPMRTPGRRSRNWPWSFSRKSNNTCASWEGDIPICLRVVSEVLSSNGSTSMGSVCGSTLSLLDAGVPLKASLSGTAMGFNQRKGKEVTNSHRYSRN